MIISRLQFLLLSLIICFCYFCTPKEELISSSFEDRLTFSLDTLRFDTLISTLKSTTKRLTLKNPNKNAVKVDRIDLENQKNSTYVLYINGVKTNYIENQVINGNDSLLILVEVDLKQTKQDEPILISEKINFFTNGNHQSVILETWAQDVNFIGKTTIDNNETFDSPKPYYLTDTLSVKQDVSLTLAAGTRIYANKNALIVLDGSLIANGTPDQRIELRNARLEKNYSHAPGQWGGILAKENAKVELYHTTIRNAEKGIRWKNKNTGAKLYLNACIIQNMTEHGLDLENVDSELRNSLLNNCGNNVLLASGGNHKITHCTFANYGLERLEYTSASVKFRDFILKENDEHIKTSLAAEIKNSILVSVIGNGFDLDLKDKNSILDIKVESSVLETELTSFSEKANILLNRNDSIHFQNIEEFNYDLDSLKISPANGVGIPSLETRDLLNRVRDGKPDVGAYEQILVENE